MRLIALSLSCLPCMLHGQAADETCRRNFPEHRRVYQPTVELNDVKDVSRGSSKDKAFHADATGSIARRTGVLDPSKLKFSGIVKNPGKNDNVRYWFIYEVEVDSLIQYFEFLFDANGDPRFDTTLYGLVGNIANQRRNRF